MSVASLLQNIQAVLFKNQDIIIGAFIMLIILSVLVLIHELGHFLTARKFKIKVEEFGFGFPLTKALFKIKRGETTYSFYPALIGGFVKLYGEDEAGGGRVKLSQDEQKDEKAYPDLDRAFFARPVRQRAVVVVAGVVMNALLAFFIYYIFLSFTNFQTELPLIVKHRFFAVEQTERLNTILISDVAKGSPAEKAGLRKCDQNYCAAILAINGTKPADDTAFINTIRENQGDKVVLTVQNQAGRKEKFDITVVPRKNPPAGQGALGVQFNMFESILLTYKTPVQKMFSGVTHPLNLMSYNLDVLNNLISKALTKREVKPLQNAISGPVGIFRLGVEINKIVDIKERFLTFLNLAGLLSISLALFNVLPIPAMDGGRLFFILVEGVVRKKVSPKVEALIHTAGMVVLMALILLITFKDIFQSY